jgi:nucleoid DNA-binding protein
MNAHEKYIRKLSTDYQIPEEVIEAIVKSPYEFIRYNSEEMISVRVPNFGLFVVKPNRVKYINERKEKGKKKRKESSEESEGGIEGEGI